MARKSSPLAEPLVYGDPTSLVKKCMQGVSRRLEQAGKIGFKEIPHARSEREFLLLSTQGGSSARARQDYPVLYFGATRSKTYWLALSLYFVPALERFRLIQASLLVFEGPWADSEKIPLLRAEWDELEEDGVHAQPHWHVYPAGAGALRHSAADDFPAAPPGPVEFVPQAAPPTDPGEAGIQDLPRFHYAMATRWHLEEGASYRCSFSEGGLVSWLVGCIDYIRGQLPHISREDLSG
jgi:hypothetical protein